MAIINFIPIETKKIDATTTADHKTFSQIDSGTLWQVRVYNRGDDLVFIKISRSTSSGGIVNATVNDTPIPAGAVEVFDLFNNDTISARTETSTAKVYLTIGQGQG